MKKKLSSYGAAERNDPAPQGADYSVYRFTPAEMLRFLAEGLVLFLCCNYLFYESLWLFLLLPPMEFFYIRNKRTGMIRRRREKLDLHFRDGLNSISTALRAGYSAENAVLFAMEDLRRLYGPGADITREFIHMETRMKVSVPLETLFTELGDRSGLEDIIDFASVFRTARRTGGDLPGLVQRVARMMSEKRQVRQEIEAAVAAKRFELTIMTLMPAGIILYLKLTSPGFLGVLYGNPLGAAVMTGCLLVCFAAWYLGKKITDVHI